jgi:tripartite-type tricarboxylate transporter receptor subunit TctC
VKTVLFVISLVLSLTFGQVAAQSVYPSKAVTIIVPYPPGGGVDILGRAMAERLSVMWGKPVIIENRPGASTIVGAQATVNAAGDGHTLMMTTDATITSNPYFFEKLPYRPSRDLAPISKVVTFDLMLLAHPTLGVSTLDELLRLGRERKDPVPYASFGNASQSHVFFAALAKSRKLNLLHVPYGGIAPSLRAVVSAEVMLSMSGTGTASPFVLDGRLKALAIARPTRHPKLPNVPTFAEVGIGDLDPTPWMGLFAPASVPLSIRNKIQEDLIKVFADKTFEEKFVTSRGYESIISTPAQFASDIAQEMSFRGKQIDLSAIKVAE